MKKRIILMPGDIIVRESNLYAPEIILSLGIQDPHHMENGVIEYGTLPPPDMNLFYSLSTGSGITIYTSGIEVSNRMSEVQKMMPYEHYCTSACSYRGRYGKCEYCYYGLNHIDWTKKLFMPFDKVYVVGDNKKRAYRIHRVSLDLPESDVKDILYNPIEYDTESFGWYDRILYWVPDYSDTYHTGSELRLAERNSYYDPSFLDPDRKLKQCDPDRCIYSECAFKTLGYCPLNSL